MALKSGESKASWGDIFNSLMKLVPSITNDFVATAIQALNEKVENKISK
jgi:hypothetical protein